MKGSWRIRSHPHYRKKANRKGDDQGRRIGIPAAIGRQLPRYAEWEVTVVDDGLHYKYLGEVKPMTPGPSKVTPANLPFME